MTTHQGTLSHWARREVVADENGRRVAWSAAFVVATALGAQVAVPLPFTPVPMTLQPLFIVLAGAVLGPRLGAATMLAYVSLGALGAPIFSNGAMGLPWLLGPTGGYLLAAPAAAFVVGALVGDRSSFARVAMAMTAGLGVIYLGGVAQLAALTGDGLWAAALVGAVPFVAGDVVKVLIATTLARSVRPLGRAGS